jgi:hypothetical protein
MFYFVSNNLRQSSSLQVSPCIGSTHGFPLDPGTGFVHDLDLVLTPTPQDSLHVPHVTQSAQPPFDAKFHLISLVYSISN